MHCFILWEARPRGEAFPAPSRRRSPRVAAPTKGAACTALFVGGPTSGRSFFGTEPAPFAAGRASHDRGGVHCFVFCGRPDLGAKLFRHRAGPFAAGRGSHDWGRRALLCFLWEARPRGEAFSDTEPAHSPWVAAPAMATGCTVYLWEARLVGPQPMVIRLALPPAAAVLMLSARSISKRSSGISVSPGAMPCMPTMGPLRRARCWLTSRNWSGLP